MFSATVNEIEELLQTEYHVFQDYQIDDTLAAKAAGGGFPALLDALVSILLPLI